MTDHDAVTDEIDRILSDLANNSAAEPHHVATRLVELIEGQDRTHAADLEKLEAATHLLHSAISILQHATTVEGIIRTVCPGAAAIATCNEVFFSELDGLGATPVTAVPEGRRLPGPFRLPFALDGPEDTGIPVAFAHAGYTAFRVDIGGLPAGLIHVNSTPEDLVVDALLTFAGLVGTALECAALDQRRHRQTDLVHALWSLEDSADSLTAPSPPISDLHSSIFEPLTTREREVLTLVLTGASNAAIAAGLVISVETVRSHVKRVLRKCGVANRAELIARFDTGPDAGTVHSEH